MASFSAKLHVGGVRYPLLHYAYSASQAIDSRGRVNEKVRRHVVFLVLDVPEDQQLEHWGMSSTKRMAADIITRDINGGQALETLHLAAAYCVKYHEGFESGDVTTGAYCCHVTLADPDGWTLIIGGPPSPQVMPRAREHGTPLQLMQAAAAQQPGIEQRYGEPVPTDIALLPTKRERYAARMQLLADAQSKLRARMDEQVAAIPRPSQTLPTETGTQEPLAPLPVREDLSPYLAAHERLSLNNMAVEHAKLSDDTYFVDQVSDSDGKLVTVHFEAHSPDGTFITAGQVEGWKIIQVNKDEESGFMAVLYKSTFTDPVQYVLAFRGTDADPDFMDELEKDTKTDGLQGVGLDTPAFKQVSKAIEATRNFLPKDTPFTLAGHSLGGAEASLAALLTGNDTYTFNSGGLHVNTIARAGIDADTFAANEPHIQAFFADNDPLNATQDHAAQIKAALKIVTDAPLRMIPGMPPINPLDPVLLDPRSLPGAIGVRRMLPSGSLDRIKSLDVKGHSVGPMIDVMEQQKTADSAALQKFVAKP